jgi:rhomboid protease GluP
MTLTTEHADEIHPPSVEKTQEWITALAAAGIPYHLNPVDDRWAILVPVSVSERARQEIEAYEEVNRGWPPQPRVYRPPAIFKTWAGFWGTHLLLLFSIWIGSFNEAVPLCRAGAGDVAVIRAGEWWRAITSLTLHAGVTHLAGNLLFLLLLSQAVCRRMGSGLGWILILAGGVLGNLVAAWTSRWDHTSVGASTACFAAVGILAMAKAVENFRRFGDWRSLWSRTWIPIGAGLALLAMTGVGERSDLSAHLFGFVCGLLVGFPFSLPPTGWLSKWSQRLLAAAAFLIVADAWLLAWLGI